MLWEHCTFRSRGKVTGGQPGHSTFCPELRVGGFPAGSAQVRASDGEPSPQKPPARRPGPGSRACRGRLRRGLGRRRRQRSVHSSCCCQSMRAGEASGWCLPRGEGAWTPAGTFWKAHLWQASPTPCPCPGPISLTDPSSRPLPVSSTIEPTQGWTAQSHEGPSRAARKLLPVPLLGWE